jgi:hypothetical protein
MGMPSQAPFAGAGQGNQNQHPSEPVPAIHSNMTMGMPTQYVQPQSPSQPVQAIHSNNTMGMPLSPPPPGQVNDQASHPSEPVPVIQNRMMGTSSPAQPQFQQPLPQNPAIHSNSTMAMPMGYDPIAALRASVAQDHQGAYASEPGPKSDKVGEKDEEEVNILAVIIFGSLSITALGGLGMLILLMFTTG